MNTKGILSALGIGMAAGAALSMAIKPRDQAKLREKAGQAMKSVGGAMENISHALRQD